MTARVMSRGSFGAHALVIFPLPQLIAYLGRFGQNAQQTTPRHGDWGTAAAAAPSSSDSSHDWPVVPAPCSINTLSYLSPGHSCKKAPFHDRPGDEGENVVSWESCPNFRTTRSTPPTIRSPTWPNAKGCAFISSLARPNTCYARRTPSTSLGRTRPYATWTTPAVAIIADSLGKEVFLCDVTSGKWYKRAPSDQTFTHLHASTFPVLHPRSAVLGVRSLPLHHMQLLSLFQRTQDTLTP